MILVLDASAVVDVLLGTAKGDRVSRALAGDVPADLVTVAHLDAEVFSGLARRHRAGGLTAEAVAAYLDRLAAMGARRLPLESSLLQHAWRLRHNIAARDALYVAATMALGARLVTTDERLARAVPGLALPL